MPQALARSLSRWGRSARWSSAKTSMARDRERMFEALGPSSAELPECVEVTVVILSFYVTSLRLTGYCVCCHYFSVRNIVSFYEMNDHGT